MTWKRDDLESYGKFTVGMAELLRLRLMETQRFGFETGWNFSLRSHQRAFMDLLDEELPDEVLLAPSCSPWSPMQNANMQDDRKCQQLQQLREWHHRVHLRFCRRIYLKQLEEGRHAHLEQPTPALSWKTSSLRDLPGHPSMPIWMCLHDR